MRENITILQKTRKTDLALKEIFSIEPYLTDSIDMNYLIDNIYKYDSIKIPTFCKSSMICKTFYSQKKTASLFTYLAVKPLNQSDYLPFGHHVNVHINRFNNLLLVEFLENVRGQKVSIFLFTLTGVLLKRMNVKKLITIIDMPFFFGKDYLMNVQIDESIYTWRITRSNKDTAFPFSKEY